MSDTTVPHSFSLKKKPKRALNENITVAWLSSERVELL